MNSITEGLLRQERKNEQFYMEFRNTFPEKNYTYRAEVGSHFRWKTLSDKALRHETVFL